MRMAARRPRHRCQVKCRRAIPRRCRFASAAKSSSGAYALATSVKNGQIVARLDPADAQKNAASAQAQLEAAQHSLVYAKQQLDRDQAQAKENLIAPAQLEQTTNAYASAPRSATRPRSRRRCEDQLQYTTLSRRSRRRDHRRTGRHRPECVRGSSRLQPRMEWRYRRRLRRAGKRACRALGRADRAGHAGRAARPRSRRVCANCRPPPIRKAALTARSSR